MRIQTAENQTGSSASPQSVAEDAPVEALILQARNTIFSEELWQELNREARSLGAFGVQSKDDTLMCPLSATKTAVFDLAPLGEPYQSGPDDSMAEGVFISLNLLLSYAHRQNHRRRTQPPPPISSQTKIIPPYNLLRALLTRLKHQETVGQLHSLFDPLCRVTTSAQLKPLPTFTLTSTPWIPPSQFPKAEQTMLSLIDRLEAIVTFSMSEMTTITIAARTSLFPISSTFHLSLSPESPLALICPPPQIVTSYSALRDYIDYFTACAIATSISNDPSFSEQSEFENENVTGQARRWDRTATPTTLRTTIPQPDGSKIPRIRQLSVTTLRVNTPTKSGLRLRALWEWSGKDHEGTAPGGRKSSFGFPVLMEEVQEGKKYEVMRIKGEGIYDWFAWDGEEGRGWDDGEGEVVRSLASVVGDDGK